MSVKYLTMSTQNISIRFLTNEILFPFLEHFYIVQLSFSKYNFLYLVSNKNSILRSHY
ncbi:hypothetical protein KORDIASMS9_00700 [Kordia sp. SMS9]|nr:hypothetical protein KORDIASMS9_00700 [Kordia sp. SMS9]